MQQPDEEFRREPHSEAPAGKGRNAGRRPSYYLELDAVVGGRNRGSQSVSPEAGARLPNQTDGTGSNSRAFPNLPNRYSGAEPMSNFLYYAVVFFVVAIIAAAFGFGGVAGTAIEGAKILFWIAIVLFGVSLVAGVIRRN
jgi:uncharacterized membrane protein YtjA (UPF0391 family)